MKIIGIFGLLATVLLVSQAGAEFYRYSDPHGNVIHTDDLNQVPEDLRSKAGVKSDTDQLSPFGQDDRKTEAIKPDQQENPDKDLDDERRRLAATKTKLEAEFRALVKENSSLKEEQKAAVTPEQVKTINRKAVNFNTHFRAYQEKKAAYDAQIEAFNKQRPTKN